MTTTEAMPPTLTIREAARILGIGEKTAYQAVRDGSIPSLRVSKRRIVIPTRRLMAMLDGEE